jgi:ribonuclease P protein component
MLKQAFRLRRAADIKRVFKRGRFATAGGLQIKAASNNLKLNRAVVIVSRQVDKRAVKRNLIRRRLIEQLAQLWLSLPVGYDIVITVRDDISGLSASQSKQLLTKGLGTVGLETKGSKDVSHDPS